MRILTLLALCIICRTHCIAQEQEILSPNIRTLQVLAGDDWQSPPIAFLGDGVRINIDFDDMTHQYTRYAYRLEHCEADWQVSEDIFASDYCQGFAEGNIIEDYAESSGTNYLYTHYHLQIPNQHCQPTMSGNYRVTVYDEDSGEDVLRAHFMLAERNMNISMNAVTATDADLNGRHQQVEMELSYGSLKVTDPQREVWVLLMQNGRRDNSVSAPPTFKTPNGMKWSHIRDFIFNGGNEFRKFETLQTSNTGLGIEKMGWDGEDYHAYLWTCEPRRSYVEDKAAKGGFLVRNWGDYYPSTTAEYIVMHFSLKTPLTKNPIYIDAEWTYHQHVPEYEMEYNEETELYEKTLLLKQGYYSYQFLEMLPNGQFIPLESEGNFHRTENSYQALVYYRPIGARTDRLAGYAQIVFAK